MSLMTNYLIKAGNAEDFFKAIRNAKAPERFTQSFLKDLEFASSNDRLYIGVLKGLGFLDENGAPTGRYFAFLDQSQSIIRRPGRCVSLPERRSTARYALCRATEHNRTSRDAPHSHAERKTMPPAVLRVRSRKCCWMCNTPLTVGAR